MHAGEAEGLTYEQLRERFPHAEAPESPFHRRIPGCETWAEFFGRVGARLQRVAQEHAGQTVVVAGHGGTVGASFVALGDLPLRRGLEFTYEARNTSITEWRRDGRSWRLVRFNDAAHLASL
jgi:probable phosphoglycerate mutase